MQFDDEILASLHHDLDMCRGFIRQVSQGMIKGQVSRYPIFVATRSEIDIDLGLPIINPQELDVSWSIHASHLEDFVHKRIVLKDKVQDFIGNYKNPQEYMCVFVAEEGMMSFVFMPYDKPKAGLEISKEQLN